MSLPGPLAILGVRAWVLFKFLLYQLVPYLGYTEIKEYIISNRFLKLSAYCLPVIDYLLQAVVGNSLSSIRVVEPENSEVGLVVLEQFTQNHLDIC